MKILNFGSLNLDYVYDVDHFVAPGETMSSLGLFINCGGKGLNQSIAAAKADPKIAEQIDGKTIVKEISVPGKIVNIVVR